MPAHPLAHAYAAACDATRREATLDAARQEPALLAAREPDPAAADLERRLRAIVDHAVAAWPGIQVDPAVFVGYLARRLGEGDLEALHADDLYLACACASGAGPALAAFERACIAPLPGPLSAAGATAALIDDIQQSLRARFLVAVDGRRGIEQFSGRGDLRGWVSVSGVREVIRARAKVRREVQVEDDVILDRLAAREDPELSRMRVQCAAELRTIFRAAMARLEPRERNLLRLHFIDGLSIDAIGEVHDVHRSTAARWLAKAEQRLQKRVRRDLKERMSVNTVELAGLWQALESQLELSIDKLLMSAGPSSDSSK